VGAWRARLPPSGFYPAGFSPLRGFGGDGARRRGRRRRIPMKLTDTQLVLLSAASQRPDGALELGAKLKGGVAHKVIGKLVSERLVEELRAQANMPVWRLDDDKGALALRITPFGLAAIGAADPTEAVAPAETPGPARKPGKAGPSNRRFSTARKPGVARQVQAVNGGQDRYRMGRRVSRLPGLTVGVVTDRV
jgi:hypothetical protein